MQLEHYTGHEFIGDTVDGGLIACLAATEGEETPIFMQGPDEAPVQVHSRPAAVAFHCSVRHDCVTSGPGPRSRQGVASASSEKLSAGCHCGGRAVQHYTSDREIIRAFSTMARSHCPI